MRIENLSKTEKIELIKKLASREIHVINGEIIEPCSIIIMKDGKYLMGEKEFETNQLDFLYSLFPEDSTLIFLPAKKEIDE